MAVILGLDPGTNSFAYSVLTLSASGKARVVQTGMVRSTMRTLTDPATLASERRQFVQQIRHLVRDRSVTHVIAERYMLRRGTGGTAIESVNMMLGVLMTLGLPTKILPAAQWKNDVRRSGYDLEAIYASGVSGLTPHQIDAAHIGAYATSLLLHSPVDYAFVLRELNGLAPVHLGESTKPQAKRKKKRGRT